MALCALALAGCMMPALAQEEADTTRLVLSLDSARQVAMEHNRTLKNASLDVQKAEASRWQNIAGMLPQVNASLDYQNMLGYEIPFRVEETNMEMRIAMPASGSIGITADGLSTTDPGEAYTKKLMLRRAHKSILLADSGKFGCASLVASGSLRDLDIVITDRGLPPEFARLLKRNKIEVVTQ